MDVEAASTSYAHRADVARLTHQVQSALVGELDEALAPFGLSAAQYAILSTLASGRLETASQICKEISYTPGAMTRMIHRLEEKRLLVRSECPDNRRKNKLELTETGRSTYPTMQAAASRAIDRYLGSFDPAELYQLESMLHRMKPRN